MGGGGAEEGEAEGHGAAGWDVVDPPSLNRRVPRTYDVLCTIKKSREEEREERRVEEKRREEEKRRGQRRGEGYMLSTSFSISLSMSLKSFPKSGI